MDEPERRKTVMNMENIKKAALILFVIYLGLRIIGMLVPAVLSVIGTILKIVFWAAVILFAYSFIASLLSRKK